MFTAIQSYDILVQLMTLIEYQIFAINIVVSGYAGHIAETVRPFVNPVCPNAGYAVALTYAIVDGATKTIDTYQVTYIINTILRSIFLLNFKSRGPVKAVLMAGDSVIWQLFASFVIPGFCINRIMFGTEYLLKNSTVKGMPRVWGPTVVGLLCIPVIVTPIDRLVDAVLDATYRHLE